MEYLLRLHYREIRSTPWDEVGERWKIQAHRVEEAILWMKSKAKKKLKSQMV